MEGVNLRSANLRKAYLTDANLRKACLTEANLTGANLTGANLTGANLRGTDLTTANLYKAKVRKIDMLGAIYSPSQLSDIIIDEAGEEPFLEPTGNSRIYLHLPGENPPLLSLLLLAVFMEKHYDTLYVILFSPYEEVEELHDMLSGSTYIYPRKSDGALKVEELSTGSINIDLSGLTPVFLLIVALCYYFKPAANEIVVDLYKEIKKVLFRLKHGDNYAGEGGGDNEGGGGGGFEPLTAETVREFSRQLKEARKPGEARPESAKPESAAEIKELARADEKSTNLLKDIDRNKDQLTAMRPREDILKTVLLLRQEGMLTNKLNLVVLANLIELHSEEFERNYKSLTKEIGHFEIKISRID